MNWYKKSQTEDVEETTFDDIRPIYECDGIKYVQESIDLDKPLYEIDIQALDKMWQKDSGYYISNEDLGIGTRRQEFVDWLKLGHPVETPFVSVYKGVVYFTNGRHRTAVLRDMGKNKMLFTVSSDSDQDALREIGGRKIK